MNKAYIEACARRTHPDMDWPEASDEVKDYIKRWDHGDAMHEIAELLMHPKIDLPWTVSEYINVTVSEWKYDPDTGKGETVIDAEKTRQALARCVQVARKLGYEVTKSYDDDYITINVVTPHGGLVKFNANRQSMCERKVVGKKLIPAQPAKLVDEVEWDCSRIALTQLDVEI